MTNLEILKTALSEWSGDTVVNDKSVDLVDIDLSTVKTITLKPTKMQPVSRRVLVTDDPQEQAENTHRTNSNNLIDGKSYRITVRSYMTKKATLEFDFMSKWNDDIPMPLVTMSGVVNKQTKGMVNMTLHGEALPIVRCMRCGKTLSNPISRKYGIGPECIAKIGIVADIEDVDTITEKLVNIEWTGWVVKSAILEVEEI